MLRERALELVLRFAAAPRPSKNAYQADARSSSSASISALPSGAYCRPRSRSFFSRLRRKRASWRVAEQRHSGIAVARQAPLLCRGRRHHQRHAVAAIDECRIDDQTTVAVVEHALRRNLDVRETRQLVRLERFTHALARRCARATRASRRRKQCRDVAILVDELAFVVAHLNIHPQMRVDRIQAPGIERNPDVEKSLEPFAEHAFEPAVAIHIGAQQRGMICSIFSGTGASGRRSAFGSARINASHLAPSSPARASRAAPAARARAGRAAPAAKRRRRRRPARSCSEAGIRRPGAAATTGNLLIDSRRRAVPAPTRSRDMNSSCRIAFVPLGDATFEARAHRTRRRESARDRTLQAHRRRPADRAAAALLRARARRAPARGCDCRNSAFVVTAPVNQARTNEDVARLRAIDAFEADAALFDQRQTEQRYLFERDRFAAARVPMRFAVAAFDEVLCRGLDPLRFDRRDASRIHALRLGDLAADEPFGARRCERRAGKDRETEGHARRDSRHDRLSARPG